MELYVALVDEKCNTCDKAEFRSMYIYYLMFLLVTRVVFRKRDGLILFETFLHKKKRTLDIGRQKFKVIAL